jgi:pimeloyl-ACP methyl ester carboxylesterase
MPVTGSPVLPPGDEMWRDWGGVGPTLHFAHANGFPPGTYRKLLETLTDRHRVVSSAARPLWLPEPKVELGDWTELAGDLAAELGGRNLRGILAVGHSLGGVASLLAAAEDPGLFRAVVAIDPLVLTGRLSVFWGLMKAAGQAHRLGLVRGARARRDHWTDHETIRSSYGRKKIFNRWDPEVLDDYIECGTVTLPGGGIGLRYPRAWEAKIFEIAPHDLWRTLRRLEVPVLFIQGEQSDTFRNSAARRAARELRNADVAVVKDSTHFVPMEKPRKVGELIGSFFQRIGDKGGSE